MVYKLAFSISGVVVHNFPLAFGAFLVYLFKYVYRIQFAEGSSLGIRRVFQPFGPPVVSYILHICFTEVNLFLRSYM